jgi:hypothetical protein
VKNNYPCDILETAWFPDKCNKKLIIYDLESDFNSNIEVQLDEKMNEFNKFIVV